MRPCWRSTLRPAEVQSSNSGSGSRLFVGLVIAAILLGGVRRVLFGLDSPIWLDEAYTGAIAIRPTVAGLVESMLGEIGGPVYYSFMWVWVKLFGADNFALRAPSILFSLATPLFIVWKGHPDRQTRLLWAAFASASIPTFFYAVEARSYALLILLAAAQIMLFLRLVAAPSLGRAALWAGLSAVFLLTHYHSAVLTGLQGLGYLWLRRQEALRTWPAALLFLPAGAWMAVHLPLVMRFSDPAFAWWRLLEPVDILRLPTHLLALPRLSWAVFLALGAAAAFEAFQRLKGRPSSRIEAAEAVAVAASLLAILLVYGLGFVRPNFTPRYLLPFMPGLLLGIALLVRALGHRWRPLPTLAAALAILSVLADTYSKIGSEDWRRNFSWEAASSDLAAQGARRLFFIWDNPTAAISDRRLMAKVAAFFFHRRGIPIESKAVILAGKGDVDPNRALAAEAVRPGDAIIWIFDLSVARTLAVRHPPRLPEMAPGMRCRDYGKAPHGVVACIRHGASPAAPVEPVRTARPEGY